jgi:hypothetical protein
MGWLIKERPNREDSRQYSNKFFRFNFLAELRFPWKFVMTFQYASAKLLFLKKYFL